MVPIMTLTIVKDTAVPAEPGPAVAGYAMPFKTNSMATALEAVWIKVRGEPAGVHMLPIAALPQPAGDPEPGAMLCRSKTTVPLGVLKVAKLLMASGPGAVAPGKFLMAPLVSPEKEPLFGPPLQGVRGFAGVLLPLALKKTPVALMVMLPETLAEPVTVWALAGVMRANALMRVKVRIE
jgi:hypothetical protein